MNQTSHLLTLVESYVNTAMKHAVPERLEDGTIAATVPECFGVIAFGADLRECGENLAASLEDWARVGLMTGFTLPVLDGIDPTGSQGRRNSGRSGRWAWRCTTIIRD